MKTKIRLLLLKEQFDQGLHYLPFYLHLLEVLMHCKIRLLYFGTMTITILGVPIFRILWCIADNVAQWVGKSKDTLFAETNYF